MKINEVRIMAITAKDIEQWLDRQPEDEVYTVKEVAEKLQMPAQSIGKRISNVSDKYRYTITQNEKYYGCPKAIQSMDEYKRSVLES